jgi:hypothetical protein
MDISIVCIGSVLSLLCCPFWAARSVTAVLHAALRAKVYAVTQQLCAALVIAAAFREEACTRRAVRFFVLSSCATHMSSLPFVLFREEACKRRTGRFFVTGQVCKATCTARFGYAGPGFNTTCQPDGKWSVTAAPSGACGLTCLTPPFVNGATW